MSMMRKELIPCFSFSVDNIYIELFFLLVGKRSYPIGHMRGRKIASERVRMREWKEEVDMSINDDWLNKLDEYQKGNHAVSIE